jgi:hypothetical protein
VTTPSGKSPEEALVLAEESATVCSLPVDFDEELLAALGDSSWGGTFRLRVRAILGSVGRALAQSRASLVHADAFLMFEPGAHVVLHLVAQRRFHHLSVELHAVTPLPQPSPRYWRLVRIPLNI